MSPQLPPPPPPAPQAGGPAGPQYQAPRAQHVVPSGPHQGPQGLAAQPSVSQTPGLAITSFVLGLVGLLLCLVPVVNILAILLAIAGGVLGAVALSRLRSGTTGGKGLAIAGVVLSILSFLGGVGSGVFYLVVVSEMGRAIEQSARDVGDDQGVAARPDEVDAAADALPLGQVAEVGDYEVAITSVNTNANDVVAEAGELNDPPTHQYVLVDLAVTYKGDDEGEPWMDLGVAVQGSDARQYDDTMCDAALPKDATKVPTLLAGGRADVQFCMDVPPAALDGATVFVEQTFTFEKTRVYWNLQ